MKPLFFLYVWLNLTRIAGLRKENLVKHIRKRTIQTGRLFFSSSLTILTGYFALILHFDPDIYRVKISTFMRVLKPKLKTNAFSQESKFIFFVLPNLKY